MTKSITSTLVGSALKQHQLEGMQQPVVSFFPGRSIAHLDARKRKITLEHLLTMTSGLECHFRPHELTLGQMMKSRDWVQFMLDLPMEHDPGTHFEYCSGSMHLVSGIITQATHMNELEYARQVLFGPLGITEAIWPADPKGVSHGWGDLHLRPLDMAKIGYLWLNSGFWNGRSLVPAEWMQAATRAQTATDFGNDYGYGLWIHTRRDPFVFEAVGRGSQRISVVPGKNLVVVFTGGAFEPGDIGHYIGHALKSDAALPPNSAGDRRLSEAISAATRPPAARPTPALPGTASRISGKRFDLDRNPIGLESITLRFDDAAQAALTARFVDGRTEERPIGLDGVPRISPAGRFGLPVALTGGWETPDIFVLDYDEVANINDYQLRLNFTANGVRVALSEKSGLTDAKFGGHTVQQK